MRAQAGESRAGLEVKLAALEGENVAMRAREAASRAREAATSRILQAIAAGPGESARALDMIAESASTLCGAYDAMIRLCDGAYLVRGGHHGPIPTDIERLPISPRWTAGRCVLERRPIHVHDLQAAGDDYPEGAEMARRLGHRTILTVPLLRGGEAIGVILLRRFEVNPFSEDDIALLATFADQAVIAVENTRLFTELSARNQEIAEALDRQTATSEILSTISRSPTDVRPVFDAIADSAARLCEAEFCHVFRFDGRTVDFVAHNYDESSSGPSMAAEVARDVFPMVPDASSAAGRVLLTGSVVNIADVHADADYALGRIANLLGYRSIMGVPMLRDGRAIGAITVMRSQTETFAGRQIEFLKTFADQAVIAIENTRLFSELREALHRQTATADVLKAISRSTFDLPTVLSTLVEAAVRLCDADQGTIARERDGIFVRVASHGFSPEFVAAVLDRPVDVDRRSASGRALVEGRVIHIPDVRLDPDYDFPEALEHGGFRSIIGVPMLRDGAPIGVLAITRREARAFTERQMELLATFADQAAIAIENARLFEEVEARTGELEESLAYQTASSEILRAISTSTTDAQPVFDTIVRNAVSLCGSLFANVFRFDGEVLHFAASHNVGPGYVELLRNKYPMRPDPSQVSGRVILGKKVIRIEDALADPDYDQRFPAAMAWQRMLGVPMLRDGVPLGVIVVGWREAGPVPRRQEELLMTFADQAVIAIENARLFQAVEARTRELQEALDYQTATSEVLGVISRSAFDLRRVFEAVGASALRLCEADKAFIFRADGEVLRAEVGLNASPEMMEFVLNNPIRPGRGSVTGRAAQERRAVQIRDASADPEYTYRAKSIEPIRTNLAVPILKDGALLGVITIYRFEVADFTPKQVALLETFADQVAIAIENARLFEAVQARTRELTEALDYQTATGEVLGVISRSAFDLERVFEAIGESALRLCGAKRAFIFRYDGEVLRAIVGLNASSELAAFVENHPIRPGRHTATARAALERRTIHIEDVEADPEFTYGARDIDPLHTTLSVPILKGDALLGVITIYKLEVEAFTPKQIALLETFADQAAIAIENARLFEDLRSALAEFHAVLDNIDYGVLFMDRELRARIVNPALRRLWDVPQDLLDRRPTVRELLEYNRDRGVYTVAPEKWDEWVATRVERIRDGNIRPGEFARADGKVYTYQCVALPDGGRMLSYFDITELKNRQAELLAAKEAAETALAELRTAQERLVQTEKLASLGQLTAGIAHEIKNPLNFVNNFAALSRDLLAELEAVLQAPVAALAAADRDDAEDLLRTMRDNLEKIVHHGKRADSIVRNMLLHARHGSGEWRAADINAIAEEALNLAYHGARASRPDCNVEIAKHLDPGAGAVECCPQDMMRVVLNLVSNGIYAANMKRASAPAGFVPRIELTTHSDEAAVAIEVRDNGTGIPAEIRDSIFVPFFTTKPAGEGTGLGLSLSHDIVVKQHGGSFTVESEPGVFTAFRVVLPRTVAADRRVEA